MKKAYPPELEQFVQQELDTGNFQNESEVLNRALEVYRELKQRHNALRIEVEKAISEADGSEAKPLDIEEVVARGNKRLAEEGIEDN